MMYQNTHNAPATTIFCSCLLYIAHAIEPAINIRQPTRNMIMRVRCWLTDLKLKNGISQTNMWQHITLKANSIHAVV